MILSLAGNDIIFPLWGNDIIDGGPGEDYVDYYHSNSSVYVNLSSNSSSIPPYKNDVLYNIEDIVGSNFNDYLTGSLVNNKFIPNRGNDTVDGFSGTQNWILYNES